MSADRCAIDSNTPAQTNDGSEASTEYSLTADGLMYLTQLTGLVNLELTVNSMEGGAFKRHLVSQCLSYRLPACLLLHTATWRGR